MAAELQAKEEVQVVKVLCTVCCEAFSADNGPRAPLVLGSCGHTFCAQCLQSLAAQSASRTILCPACRTPCNIDTDARRNWRLADVAAGDGVVVESPSSSSSSSVPSAPPAEQMVFASPAPTAAAAAVAAAAAAAEAFSYIPFRVVREEALRAATQWADAALASSAVQQLAPVLVPFFAVGVAATARVEAFGDASAVAAFSDEADFVFDGVVCAWADEKARRLVDACFPAAHPAWDLSALRTATSTVPDSVPWLPSGAASAASALPPPKLAPHVVPEDAIERFRAQCQDGVRREAEKRLATLRRANRGKRLQASAAASVRRRRLVYVPFFVGTYGTVSTVFVDGVTGKVGGDQPQRRGIAESIFKALHFTV